MRSLLSFLVLARRPLPRAMPAISPLQSSRAVRIGQGENTGMEPAGHFRLADGFLAGLRTGQLSAGSLPAQAAAAAGPRSGIIRRCSGRDDPSRLRRSPAAPAQTSWFAAKRPPATSTGAPACRPSRARRRGTARAAAEVAAYWSSWRASSKCRNCWSASSARPAGRGTYRPNIPGQHPN